jgi:predicted aspartyl protease
MTISNLNMAFRFILTLVLLGVGAISLIAGNKEEVNLPFRLINGMIVLNLEVNGNSETFLLDTGADGILVDGNHEGSTKAVLTTLGGELQVGTTELNRLQIGSLIHYDVAAQVMSLSLLEENLGIDLFGIIGGAYFFPRSLYMDFTNATITISDSSFDKGLVEELSVVKFEMVNGLPIVPVTIEGKRYHFAMDSGASTHFLDESLLSELESITASNSSATVLSANHISTAISRYDLPQFQLGKISFEQQDCLLQNFDAINLELEKPISGILSLSALAKDKVVIDFKKQRMYF